MNFRTHSELKDQHAFLSASKYHWLNYDADKLGSSYHNYYAQERGTKLHEFAAECIRLGIKLPRTKSTLNAYVNDAIGFKLRPEKPLYYSDNAFGTADAIGFRKNVLRIHDYKSGRLKASFKQLEIYAAFFCLEYGVDPCSISLIELRIYQSDEVRVANPTGQQIQAVMDKIIESDRIIENLEEGEVDWTN